jgi:hypothetical protein
VSKVIFLDFDGPMIPMRAWVLNMDRAKYEVFDPVAAATVKRALDAAHAKLVITSTWRLDGRDACIRLLEMAGIDRSYLHADWATPKAGRGGPKSRAAEIYLWLAKHPEVRRHAVIDDENMEIPNLIHVSMEDGIQMRHQRFLFNILGVELQ